MAFGRSTSHAFGISPKIGSKICEGDARRVAYDPHTHQSRDDLPFCSTFDAGRGLDRRVSTAKTVRDQLANEVRRQRVEAEVQARVEAAAIEKTPDLDPALLSRGELLDN